MDSKSGSVGRWTILQVLMLLVALSHLLQPLLLVWRPKFVVASAGAVLYTVCFLGLLRHRRWALWIAVLGPILGFSTLCLGAALLALGVIRIPLRPDVYTFAGGLFQVPALVLAAGLLGRVGSRASTRDGHAGRG
jgi:hypothetical protein